VIGHEMTHGFDDQGSKYDGKGNLREWQTAEDRKEFTERTDCVADEYSGLRRSGTRRSGSAKPQRQTHTGRKHSRQWRPAHRYLRCSIHWHQRENPSTKKSTATQRSSATSSVLLKCGARTRQSRHRVNCAHRSHSPGKWRVNGSVQNFDEFGKALAAPKGSDVPGEILPRLVSEPAGLGVAQRRICFSGALIAPSSRTQPSQPEFS